MEKSITICRGRGRGVGGLGQPDGHPALTFCGLPQAAAQLGAAEWLF